MLLAQQRPDGVIIATPNALHVDNALRLHRRRRCRAGREAGRAHDGREGLARCAPRANAAGVPVLVGHHRAHSPIIAKAREIVQQGTLGQLVAVKGSAMFYKPDAISTRRPWRREPGGGPILINMIHEIGNLRSLLRRDRRGAGVRVQRDARLPVEDTVAINLRFANGALGNVPAVGYGGRARSWEQTSQREQELSRPIRTRIAT